MTNKTLKTAPMVTVAPPTPVTALDRVYGAKHQIQHAIEHMQRSRIHHTPLWSDLHSALHELDAAIEKLSTK